MGIKRGLTLVWAVTGRVAMVLLSPLLPLQMCDCLLAGRGSFLVTVLTVYLD